METHKWYWRWDSLWFVLIVLSVPATVELIGWWLGVPFGDPVIPAILELFTEVEFDDM